MAVHQPVRHDPPVRLFPIRRPTGGSDFLYRSDAGQLSFKFGFTGRFRVSQLLTRVNRPVQPKIFKRKKIQAVFGSCKSIFEKYSIFRKCYFPERKMFSSVWLPQNSFYEKLISVFGSFKHFYRKCFTCPIFHTLPQL